jgi:hypothetical protein
MVYSQVQPPDEFVLELKDRERMDLLQFLEQSLAAPTEGFEGNADRAGIRRKLQDKIRMFGA